MEGAGKKKSKKNRPGTDSSTSSGSANQPAPPETRTQPAVQQEGGKGKGKKQQRQGGDGPQTQHHEQKKQHQQQQPSLEPPKTTGDQQTPGEASSRKDEPQLALKDQEKIAGKQKKLHQQQLPTQTAGEQQAPVEATSSKDESQYAPKTQGKKDWKQKKQLQQQEPTQATGEQQTPGEASSIKDEQQLAPKDQGKKDWKQKKQDQQHQDQHQQGRQQHAQHQQGQQQPKLSYKQKKEQHIQSGQQEGRPQQGQQQMTDSSANAQQPKLSYKQRQQMKQPSEKQQHEATPPTPTSMHSSSPEHAAALERVEEDFNTMKIDKHKIRASNLMQVLERPNAHGTRGNKIRVEVNYIQLLVDRLIGVAYHYDVDIKPPASRKWQRSAFQSFAREVFPGYNFAFDGNKNAYSAKRLKSDYYENEVNVQEDGRQRKFTVAMKEAAVVDISCLKNYMNNSNYAKPMAAIQCLDVVLRTAYENNPKFVKFKKSIYVVPSEPENIGANHELWYGLFQSALLGSKPFLNIDVSHKAFPSGGPILKILSDLNRSSIPDEVPGWMAAQLNDYLKGMEISYTGPNGVNKIFKFNRLKNAAKNESFKTESGQTLTVDQYFRQLGRPLKYPHFPVMHVGSTIRNILLPIELCSVPPGQALTKKHPDSCTQNIIRRSATDTATRKKKIMDLFNQINYNNASTIKEFGLGVGNAFEEVDGRILSAPHLQYRDNKTVQPARGVWRADNFNFIVPSTDIVKRQLRWTILNLDFRTRPDAIERFGKMIYDIARRQNVQLEPFSMANNFYEPRDMRSCVREIDNIFKDLKSHQMDLVIVVIPASGGPNGDVYAKVKQKAELVTGLLTQCVKGDTLFKKGSDPSTLHNIWLKINAKTNGSNHVLVPTCKPPISRKNVMFIGADVTHPSPEQTNIPSVVGVAASYDLEGFRYNCCYRLQNPKDEMIRDLENIVRKQIQLFRQQNKCLPHLIMYYRDGVSEGQFAEILTIELRAIQDAAARTEPDYKPNITFIVVQKRHHARFFPTRGCPTEGRNNNVPPGTIVDKYITAPNQYQFFLVSHAAVQGVAKPTKYCVLYDDQNCNPDELQALTYNLCHMFARCNRSVSYPAPTYYAHLAAYRGRVYIKDRPLNMNNLLQEYQNLQIRTEIIDGHPMFFV